MTIESVVDLAARGSLPLLAVVLGLCQWLKSFIVNGKPLQGNIISLQQLAQASPGSMGTTTKWEYKLEGKTLTLKPVANPGVEFSFERLP